MSFRLFGQPFGRGGFGRSLGQGGGGSNPNAGYILYDRFSTALAAGSVNGTLADTGQARTVIDTNNVLSIAGGVASFATGGVGAGNPGLWYPQITRALGLILMADLTYSANNPYFGLYAAQSGVAANGMRFVSAATLQAVENSTAVAVAATVAGTTYKIIIILRTSGLWLFIKGGAFTNWTLLWTSLQISTNPYPGAGAAGTTDVFTVDNFRMPVATYIPAPLAYDTFTRANGALGSTETAGPDSQVISTLAWSFTVGIWAISTNKAVATPVLGADVIVNGAFAADTDWTKGANWTIAAGVASAAVASSNLTAVVDPSTVGRWHQVAYTVSGFAAGTVRAVLGGVSFPTHAADATYTETGKAGTTAFLFTGAGFTGNLDDVSSKLLTTAELFSSVILSSANVVVEVAITLPAALGGVQAGLVLNLDSTSNPQNFILVYLDGRGNCVLEECVAGVYGAAKFTTAITYSAGALLKVIRDGTSCRVIYNTIAVSTVQTMTANTNLNHGLFSTSALNSLDSFTVWARGTGNEYSQLDTY